MTDRMAGQMLEKLIDSLMAEGMDFPEAFMAATMIKPGTGLPELTRQEAIEVIQSFD